jgi:hypothetical protein
MARYAVAALAATGFAGGVAVARAAHPGSQVHRGVVTGTLDAPQSFRDAEQSALDFGGSAIAPAAGTDQPAVQSAGS